MKGQGKQWKELIVAEVLNFVNREAWKERDLEDVITQGRKPIGTKTVLKIKDEAGGTQHLKTRIATLGCSMIPGQDCLESLSPVPADASNKRIVALSLCTMNRSALRQELRKGTKEQERLRIKESLGPTTIYENSYLQDCNDWTIEVHGAEAAFLNADAGHKQCAHAPEAMIKTGLMTIEQAWRTVCEPQKSMHGNVDAASRFFETCQNILANKMGMKQCAVDPCVFCEWSDELPRALRCAIACHNDDSIIAGRKTHVDKQTHG